MKFRINADSEVNRVGQCPFAYVSGKDANLQSIYDQIWSSGYGGIERGMMLLRNNQRKMHGLPLWRKKSRKKRKYTRCEADETISAFLDYCNSGGDEE